MARRRAKVPAGTQAEYEAITKTAQRMRGFSSPTAFLMEVYRRREPVLLRKRVRLADDSAPSRTVRPCGSVEHHASTSQSRKAIRRRK